MDRKDWARIFLLLPLYFVCIHSHGRLMSPPARNCMWRFGFGTPVNYNDNEVYCGGFGIQFKKNKGKIFAESFKKSRKLQINFSASDFSIFFKPNLKT